MARQKEEMSLRSYKDRKRQIKDLNKHKSQNLKNPDFTTDKAAQIDAEIERLEKLNVQFEALKSANIEETPDSLMATEVNINTDNGEIDILAAYAEPPKVVNAPNFSFNIPEPPKVEETPETETEETPKEENVIIEIPPEKEAEIAAKKEQITGTPKVETIPTVETRETENGKVAMSMPSEWSAKHIIGIGDKLMTAFTCPLYDAFLITQEERAFMKAANRYQKEKQAEIEKSDSKETAFVPIPVEFEGVFAQYEEIERLKEKIPLTNEEKESLLLPLEMFLRDKNIELSPGKALITVVGIIMLPRFMPLVSHYLKKSIDRQTEIQAKVFQSYFTSET